MDHKGLSDKMKLGQVLKEARCTAVHLSGVRPEARVCVLERREAGLGSTRCPRDLQESGGLSTGGGGGGTVPGESTITQKERGP